jgi:uncharacterized protein (DUF697 family)
MEKHESAEKIIKEHVAWSVAGGLVPIPLLDILAVTGIQLDMLKQLCRVYAVNYSESSGKAILSTLAGTSLASLGASAIKAIPFVGTLIGGISMPVLSGATTYAIGEVVVRHFESGGNLFDIDFGKMKDLFEEYVKKGKEVALQIQKKQKGSSRDDIVKELEKLAEMRAKGEITEDEFETRKQKLLEQL